MSVHSQYFILALSDTGAHHDFHQTAIFTVFLTMCNAVIHCVWPNMTFVFADQGGGRGQVCALSALHKVCTRLGDQWQPGNCMSPQFASLSFYSSQLDHTTQHIICRTRSFTLKQNDIANKQVQTFQSKHLQQNMAQKES